MRNQVDFARHQGYHLAGTEDEPRDFDRMREDVRELNVFWCIDLHDGAHFGSPSYTVMIEQRRGQEMAYGSRRQSLHTMQHSEPIWQKTK